MDLPLIGAALALGIASTPHCALMCGAPCAALTGGCRRNAGGFHAGRWIGYAAAGAVAAGSVAALGAWSQAAPAVRPLWTLLHLAFLALGLWWLATGASPPWLRRTGGVAVRVVGRRGRPLRSGLAGLAWVAWPCGALQAALMLAALSSDAAGGAVVMASFAVASTPALAAAPWAWARLQVAGLGRPAGGAARRWPPGLDLRIAGAALVLASGWALTHGLWRQLAAYCAAL